MTTIFRITKMNHSLAFQYPRPSNHEIIVKLEKDSWFSYEVNKTNGFDVYVTTFVPLLVPVGLKPPYGSVSAVHDFYLRGEQVVMVPENSKLNWTTFTMLVETSEQLRRENFPPALSGNSSSSESPSDVTTVSEARTDAEEKPEICLPASASVERPPLTRLATPASENGPAIKRNRSN